MGKRFNKNLSKNLSKMSLVVSLALSSQMLLPAGNAFAAVNSSVLPPSNLTSQLTSPDDIKLTWSSVYGASGYNVYVISEGQLKLLGSAASTSYTISNQAEGTYTYVVSTMSAEGESGPGAPVEVNIDYPEMLAPASVSHTMSNGNDFTLTWSASSYAQSYQLYQLGADGSKTPVTTVSGSTTYRVTNAPQGTYTYVVSAVNSLYGESAPSEPRTVDVVYPAMAAPEGFTYTVSNGSDVNLRWTAASYATAYRIYDVTSGTPVLKTTVTGTTAKLSAVPAGDYVYEVRSFSDRFGESAVGSTLSATVSAVTMTAPEGFAAKLVNGNDIVLSWGAVANASNYKVYQIVDGVPVLKSTVTGTSVTYAKSAAGDYTFEVRSNSDRFGESAESSSVSVSVTGVTMTAPQGLASKLQNVNDVVLSWTAAPNATGYKIYQIVDGQPVLKSTVTGTSVTYTNVPGGQYTYEVRSTSTRYGDSAEGAQVSVTVEIPALLPPASVSYQTTDATAFTLSWEASANATGYKVYQITGDQKVLKKTVSGTSTSFTNMQPGDYVYEVYATSTRFGESAEGTRLSMTLEGQVMAAPTNGVYTVANGNDVTLRWTAAENATGYKVYQIAGGEKVLKSTVTGTSVSYQNQAAGEYAYVVHSNSSLLGESPAGAEINFNLVHPVMAAPAGLTQKIQNGNDVVLSWTAAAYATGYKVYEIVDGQKVLKASPTGVSTTITKVSNGNHSYVVHSVSDQFGESPEGSETVVTVNQETVAAPAGLNYTVANGNDFTLRWTAATYATSYKIYQIVDGQPVLKKTVSSTSSGAFTNMPAGEYVYEVRSVSDRFGESLEASRIEFSLVHPVMQAPTNQKYSINNGNDFSISWTAAAYATGYKVYQVSGGQKTLVKTTTGASTSFTNMPAGDYVYEIRANSDRFGESAGAAVVSFTLVHPVVQAPELKGSVFNANNITFTWARAEWANEYRLYEIKNGSRELVYKGTALTTKVFNLTETTHTYELTAYSTRFGESAPSASFSENIVYPVMQAPAASIKVTGTTAQFTWNLVTYANGYNVYEVIDGKPVALTQNLNNLSFTVSNLPYANHEYYVTSYSNSFGESAPSNPLYAKLIVDTTAPVTTVSAPEGWTNGDAAIALSATDSETGIAGTYYAVNGGEYAAGTSLILTEEGIHTVSYYSVDRAGNREASKTVTVKIDRTAPVTKASEMSADGVITLTASDAESGVDRTYYTVNGSAAVAGREVVLTEDGLNKITFYSVDAAGNKEEAQTVEVMINRDQTAPVTTAAAPTGWVKEDAVVTLTGTDEGSAVKTFYAVNGGAFVEGTSLTVTQDGVTTVTYYSVDEAGNQEAVQSLEVKIDRTAPVTTAAAPTGLVKEDAVVTLTGTDAVSAVKTFYAVNGGAFVEGNSLTVKQDGITTVTYYSVDEAGNQEAVQSLEVKIDRTAPVTTAAAPTGWVKEEAVVTLTGKDAVSAVKTFYAVNGGAFVEGTRLTVKQDGITTVTYYSVDEAGNQEAAKSLEVKIDRTAPVVTMSLGSEYTAGAKLPLTYTAKDEESGVASQTMTVTSPDGKSSTAVNGTSISLDKPGVYVVKVTVTNGAGVSTTVQQQFVTAIKATIEVTPKVIKGNNGVFTVRVDLPAGYSTQGFDVMTAAVNGVKALNDSNGYANQAKNGQFKFERSDFNWTGSQATLVFRGYVNGQLVVGQTTVTVQK